MRVLKRTILIHVLLILAACASPLPQIDYYDVPLEALQRIRGMSIVGEDELSQGGYRELGEVEGLYCNRNAPNADSPEATAIDQAKLRAAMKGADRIGTPQCSTRTTWDLTNNCFSTTTCSATAFAVAD